MNNCLLIIFSLRRLRITKTFLLPRTRTKHIQTKTTATAQSVLQQQREILMLIILIITHTDSTVCVFHYSKHNLTLQAIQINYCMWRTQLNLLTCVLNEIISKLPEKNIWNANFCAFYLHPGFTLLFPKAETSMRHFILSGSKRVLLSL